MSQAIQVALAQQSSVSLMQHLRRLARLFTNYNAGRLARLVGSVLVVLSFAVVAHAQETMDFSGAQTLMVCSKLSRFMRVP